MTKAEFLSSPVGTRFIAAMRLTGLRPVTLNNYARRIAQAATQLRTEPENLTSRHAEQYICAMAAAGATNINAATTSVALKFFVVRVLNRPWHDFGFPVVKKHRKQRSRPLTREEITQLLQAVSGTQYRVMFALMYGSGLRLGETCRLKIRDVDFHSGKIYIRDGKGGRHRETVLSGKSAAELKLYIASRRPLVWLFPSSRRSYATDTLFPVVTHTRPISVRSVDRAFSRARNELNLAGLVTVHSLRHSFATHVVEYGMPVLSLQRLLGHRYLQTTLGYLSSMGQPVVADFSPYDRL